MIESKDLFLSYGSKKILENISLDVKDGEFLCLLGQSGCGKSSLLRVFSGLLAPTAGNVLMDGIPVNEPNRNCSVVFQDYSLFPWMTTGGNLMFALRAAYPKRSGREIRSLAESYLEMVGLSEVFCHYPDALSGGMRQRAAIARALAMPSRVLLMDEPFGALDPVNRALLQDLMRNLHTESRGERTVVFVTHDVDEALYLGTRIVVLGSSPGRVLADEENPQSRKLGRNALFHEASTVALQQKILAVYRRDMTEKLENKMLFRAGAGI